jgi:hypothetical protein
MNATHYDASTLPQLEQQLSSMLSGDVYDMDVCLSIMKLYRMNPSLAKVETIVAVMAKALTRLPSTDFLQLSYLIPEDLLQKNAGLTLLFELNDHIQAGAFGAFWKRAGEMKAAGIPHVAGFEDAARAFIVGVLQRAYRRVPAATLSEAVNGDAAALAAKNGWGMEGDLVVFPLNEHNQARPAKFTEAIEFSQLSSLISQLTAVA